MPDFQTLLNIVLTVGLPAVGWYARIIYDEVKEVRMDLAAHKVKVAETYVTHEKHTRIEERLDSIQELLSEVLIRLGGKADR